MKTYEETLICVLRKAAEREKQNEKKKKRLSLIAAVAAALILFTAIPVGSIMIASRANQPMEAPGFDTDLYATDTERVNNTNILDLKTPFIRNMTITADNSSSFSDITTTAIPSSDLPQNYRLKDGGRYLELFDGLEGNKLTDGGLLRRTYMQFAHEFTGNEVNYQVDIVLSDGEHEICHETYVGQEDLHGMINIILDFYLLVPDRLEYGELHFYLNALEKDEEAVSEFDDEPISKMCVGFAQKYQCMQISYGDEKPKRSREELLKCVDEDMHSYIYWCVDDLYSLKNGAGRNMSAEKRELMKEIYTAILMSFKADHPEEYKQIIEEFRDNDVKTYDKNGNLKDTLIYRHDPLEDMNKSAT